MNRFIKTFKVDTTYLSNKELEILNRLIKAAQLIAKVYERQCEDGCFYPKGASRQEIEKAAAKNPDILSPYTVLERDRAGNLIAVPYHIKYKELLIPVADKLVEAAKISTSPLDFRRALLTQAKTLLTGRYEQAQIAWLKIKPYILDIVIGPIERVEDNLFFVKRSYEAWVGVMDPTVTERINTLKEIAFSARRQILLSGQVDFMKKSQLRADNTVVFSGMIANYGYTATTLPNEINLLEKYGSEAWLFLPSVKENFRKRQLVIFNGIFASYFKQSFSEDLLTRGYMLLITMHEIARIIIRYRFATERLKELYPVFNEATVEAMAMKLAGNLLLKDVITQKEMEAALVMFITRMFDGYAAQSEQKSGFTPLVSSNAILLNSLLAGGAIKITKEGVSWPNFTKMFFSVSELAGSMEKILAEGTYQDAVNYVGKHSSNTIFKKFSPALKIVSK